MAVICPSLHKENLESYHIAMERMARFAHRIQIDLTDGDFAKPRTINPKQAWWPVGVRADIHLMYKNPMPAVREIIHHKPHLIIIHAESRGNFPDFAEACKKRNIKVGVALLPNTSPLTIAGALPLIDHVLIFSGDLGKDGGHADLSQLEKVKVLKAGKHDLEIGWDGGVNDQNISQLVFGGVDVLNVGGYIQGSANPEKAYNNLERIIKELP